MFSENKVLVVGMARSGIASAKYLLKDGATVVINDSKPEDKLEGLKEEFKGFTKAEYLLGQKPSEKTISEIDFCVVSPGVPLELDFIKAIKAANKPVISEVELAYKVAEKKGVDFIGITGTNGKTTTTSMVGEIIKEAGYEGYIVGNIGNPVITAVDEANSGAVLVTELSSFQLESVDEFRPKVSTVLNLTEDHMDRHHTLENYAKAKATVFKRQGDDDFCILNYDDEITRKMAEECKAKVVFFSRKTKLENGIYTDENKDIFYKGEKVLNAKELSLPGAHNCENSMAAMAICLSYGVDMEVILSVLKTFKAVEHRLEYVDTVNEVAYVNDSKGTNPDSTIKAVSSYENPIILIAGGYDKGSDFNELFEIAKDYVRTVVVLGQTADLIEETARKHGISEILRVASIEEAVRESSKIANKDEVVLLSPACASWGMYNNYEERGRDFKEAVKALKNTK